MPIRHLSRGIDFQENLRHRIFFSRAGSFDAENFSISYENLNWYEYFKCGIRGIRDKYPDVKFKGIRRQREREVKDDGNVCCRNESID